MDDDLHLTRSERDGRDRILCAKKIFGQCWWNSIEWRPWGSHERSVAEIPCAEHSPHLQPLRWVQNAFDEGQSLRGSHLQTFSESRRVAFRAYGTAGTRAKIYEHAGHAAKR